MNILEGINDSLRRFSDFGGRSNRTQYNSFLLFYILVDFFITFANPKATTLNSVVMAALLVPMIAVEIRRSHDIGKSGWWILVPFYSLYLMFKPSVEAPPADKPSL